MGFFSRLAAWLRPSARTYDRAEILRTVGRRPPRDAVRWPQFLTHGLTPERLASIQKIADQGYLQDLMTLLQEIAGREGLIQGLLVTRLSALSRREVRCEPSDSDPDEARAAEVADFCERLLKAQRLLELQLDGGYREVGRLPSLVEALSIASFFGAAAGWRHWSTRPGDPLPLPLRYEPFDERRFAFDVGTETLHLSCHQGAHLGVPSTEFDPALYLEVRNTRLSRRLSYAGAGRAILVPWAARLSAQKDLLSYLEVWALPSIFGVQSAEVAAAYTDDARATFRNLIEDVIADTRGVLPPGFDIKTITAVAGGEAVFEFVDHLTERVIQFALVGNTGTSSGEGGSLAKAEVNERVQAALVDGDARMVGEALESYLAPAVALWFGEGTPPAKVIFEPGEDREDLKLEADVLNSAATALAVLRSQGVRVDIEAFAERFGIPLLAPEPTEEQPTQAPPPEV